MNNLKVWIAAAGLIGFGGVTLVLIIFEGLKRENNS